MVIVYIKNKTHKNSSDNNDNVNTTTTTTTTTNNNNNNNNNNNIYNESLYKQEEKKSRDNEIKLAKIFKQIIMTSQHYPLTFLPRFPVLNPLEKQLYK